LSEINPCQPKRYATAGQPLMEATVKQVLSILAVMAAVLIAGSSTMIGFTAIISGAASSVQAYRMFDILSEGPMRYCMTMEPTDAFMCQVRMVPDEHNESVTLVVFTAYELVDDGSYQPIPNMIEEFEWRRMWSGGWVRRLTSDH